MQFVFKIVTVSRKAKRLLKSRNGPKVTPASRSGDSPPEASSLRGIRIDRRCERPVEKSPSWRELIAMYGCWEGRHT